MFALVLAHPEPALNHKDSEIDVEIYRSLKLLSFLGGSKPNLTYDPSLGLRSCDCPGLWLEVRNSLQDFFLSFWVLIQVEHPTYDDCFYFYKCCFTSLD